MDISAALGVAVAEVPMLPGVGTPDYTLFVDRQRVGVVEVKAHGAFSGAEAQSARYASGADGREVRDARPQPALRYRFESNGHKTYFTDSSDPIPRSREVFNFPQPRTLAELSARPAATLRSRLQRLPALDESRLWAVQGRAINALEASFARADERALIQMATGAGKTFTAVNVVYRLLKHAGAKRVLFLVDRNNLGRQAHDEFANFAPPDDARKFPELYAVQRLDANVVNPAAKVVITTIQRLFSMLKGESEYDAGNEDDSAFNAAPWRGEPPEVVYNAAIPPEFFDFIVIDECHRSIYDLWSQVLLYFDAFVIVDAVGVCEQDKTDSQTLNRQPSKSLKQVLDYIAQGGLDPEALTTLASRLARLQRRLATPELAELRELAGGESLTTLAHSLLQAGDADAVAAAAKARFDVAEPSETQIEAAARQLARDAATPFLKPALRRRILEVQRQSEQTVDRHTIDEVLYSGFDAAALEKARAKVTDFRAWLQENKDEIAAIQAIYAGTRPLKLTLADLRQLRTAIAEPPVAATPTQLWRAFEASAPERVQGQGGEPLADLVHLVRCALLPNFTLVPYRDGLRERYQAWLQERHADNAFTEDQRQWLDHIAEHIANSLAIEPADFESGWFGQQGSLGRAHALFGDELKPLLAELNERLAA